MIDHEKKYYFSSIAMSIAAITMCILTSFFVLLIIVAFRFKIALPLLLCLPLLLIFVDAFPNYLRFMHCFLTNRPALTLSPNELIDNINGQTYRWADILEINSRQQKGTTPGTYISITLVNPEIYINKNTKKYVTFIRRMNTKYFGGTFSISHNAIKCKETELLESLVQFHAKYKSTNINGGI